MSANEVRSCHNYPIIVIHKIECLFAEMYGVVGKSIVQVNDWLGVVSKSDSEKRDQVYEKYVLDSRLGAPSRSSCGSVNNIRVEFRSLIKRVSK